MTSNIGAQKITGKSRKSLGFAEGDASEAERTFEQIKEDVMGELKNAVRPEFLNRIDDIIVFNRLSEEEIAQIADNMLRQVASRMQDMEITMDWTDAAKKHLAKAGFDPVYGASATPRGYKRGRGPCRRGIPRGQDQGRPACHAGRGRRQAGSARGRCRCGSPG